VLDELQEELASSLDVLDLEVRADQLTPTTTAEAYASRTDVLGEALRLVATLADQTGPSPSVMLGLSNDDLLGLASEAGEELDTYLRALLKGGETQLLEALLRTDRN
jgi:phage FluMu protein gp41